MRRWILVGFIAVCIGFSLLPTLYELTRIGHVQPNRHFELVHNFYTDYNFYLSRIREGREGAWLVTEKYTSEPHQGSLMHIMYLLMGKVSAFVRVPWPNSGDTYHVGRIVAAIVLLALIAHAATSAFSRFRWQMIAFFLAATSGTWPILVYHMGWRLGGYMPWWTIMDVLQRTTFVPHMLVGQALIVFLLVAMRDERVMARSGNWMFLGVLACMLGIVFPPGLMFIASVFAVFLLLEAGLTKPWQKKSIWKNWKTVRLVGPAVVGLMSAPTVLYLYLALSVYPWKRIVDYAMLHPQPFVLWDYVRAMGPMLPLGIVGAVVVFVKKAYRYLLYVGWVIAWAILIIAFQYIHQESPLRFTEMLPHVPLGFLCAYLLSTLITAKKQWEKPMFVVLSLYGVLIFFQFYSSWLWQKEFIDHKLRATYPLVPTGSYVMYPLNDMMDVMIYIQDHTKRTDVILSETTAGNYLPVYAGNTAYIGHAGTVREEEKEGIVRAFYSGQMSEAEAKQFIQQQNIKLVIYGPQEVDDGGGVDLSILYPFLVSAYHNDTFQVYAVK